MFFGPYIPEETTKVANLLKMVIQRTSAKEQIDCYLSHASMRLIIEHDFSLNRVKFYFVRLLLESNIDLSHMGHQFSVMRKELSNIIV